MTIKEKWNRRYRENNTDAVPAACHVLGENLHLLPPSGQALDLACGPGGNAILLAEHGLHVDAWDISDVVIAGLQAFANREALDIDACVRDVESDPPGELQFDVITVSYFLDRKIIPALVGALRPGGLIFYQTFVRDRVSDRGPARDKFRLADQELLKLFYGLKVLYYRDEGNTGDIRQGCRDEAEFIGMKPV